MTKELQAALDEAAALQSEIDTAKAGLKDLEAKLTAVKKAIADLADKRPDEAKPTDGGGRSWNYVSSSGTPIRVTQAAAALASNISGELLEKAKALAGRAFKKLFVESYKCQKNFRQLALEKISDRDQAKKLIALLETPSVPTVKVG
jgi:hypothetical protein